MQKGRVHVPWPGNPWMPFTALSASTAPQPFLLTAAT